MSYNVIFSAMTRWANSQVPLNTIEKEPPAAPEKLPSLIASIGNWLARSSSEDQKPLTPTPIQVTSSQQTQSIRIDHQSLEEPLKDQVYIKIDVKAKLNFRDFLSPNEQSPKNVKPHLEPMSQGLMVSTGTERSFYDLLLSSEEKCTGLVVRDINPRVKAYVDFVILLLRICDTREEFLKLSSNPKKKGFDARIELIKEKLIGSDVPTQIKEYYLTHLSDFATIYFPEKHLPEHGDNTQTDYRSDDRLFAKLQRYAKAGAIIATVGSINDLQFLGDQKVAVVDTSNVCDYEEINLKGNGEFNPITIWTKVPLGDAQYFSHPFDSWYKTITWQS